MYPALAILSKAYKGMDEAAGKPLANGEPSARLLAHACHHLAAYFDAQVGELPFDREENYDLFMILS